MNFTDQQLQSVATDFISYPSAIAKFQKALVNIQANQASLLVKDQTNIVFQTNAYQVLTQYQWELQNINGQIATKYILSNQDSAAKMQPGNIHYPQGKFVLYPQVDPSNNGLPLSSTLNNELVSLGYFAARAAIMTSGLAGNTASGTSSQTLNASSTSVNYSSVSGATAFSPGQGMLIYDGADFAEATVNTVTGSTIGFTYVIPPNGTLSVSATLSGSFPAFSNSQRQTLPSTTAFNSIRFSMDKNSTLIKQYVSNQLDALNANSSGDPLVSPSQTNDKNFIAAINNWQNGPSSGTSGRYSNSVLNLFLTVVQTRKTQSTTRATQIISALGSVASNPDGTYAGSGQYLNCFKTIDYRINFVTGSLTGYYNSANGVAGIQAQINSTQQKQSDYSKSFVVISFAKDASGTPTVTLSSVTGLISGSIAKVMADSQPVLTTKILGISVIDNSVTFDKIITSDYSTANSAVVLMQK